MQATGTMDHNHPSERKTESYPGAEAFLAEAGVPDAFAARAVSRIQGQHDALDHSYLWASLGALVRELGEEAEDLAAWASLLADRLEHDGDAHRERGRALLIAITQRAAEADRLMAELRRLLEAGTG
jgi:hypothetical protein